MTDSILHITSRSAWEAARQAGSYGAEFLTEDGFIHCSLPSQVLRVANRYYANRHGLVLLSIDPLRLTSELRWEPGEDRPDDLFPHIYGRLNLDAVVDVFDLEPEAGGGFTRLPG